MVKMWCEGTIRVYTNLYLSYEFVVQCTEVRFASILSGGFTTMAIIDPPEKKLAKCTSLQWLACRAGN